MLSCHVYIILRFLFNINLHTCQFKIARVYIQLTVLYRNNHFIEIGVDIPSEREDGEDIPMEGEDGEDE